MEIRFCDLTKICSSESNTYKNQPKKCKSFVFLQVQGDYVFIVHLCIQLIIQRVPFEQQTKKGVFGAVRTEANRRYILPVLPVPDTSVSSVRHQYRYRTLRWVRYDINTGTGHFGKFGTSIPVPDTSVSSVHGYRYRRYRYRLSYRYRTLREFRYNINTGTGHFGKFGTSIPLPVTSVSSVRYPYRYREYRYRTEQTLKKEWKMKLKKHISVFKVSFLSFFFFCFAKTSMKLDSRGNVEWTLYAIVCDLPNSVGLENI